MAWDVLHCIHDGQEAADQVRRTDHAVVDFLLYDRCWWRRRRLRLAEEAEHRMPRIGGITEGTDAGLRSTAFLFEAAANALERVEQVEQRTALAPRFGFAIGLGPIAARSLWLLGAAGGLGLCSTTMSRAAATIRRLTANSAVRNLPRIKRWSGFDIRSTVPPSVSPISANSFAMTPKSGSRQRSIAEFRFMDPL